MASLVAPVWKLHPGSSAAWDSPDGRWMVYQLYGSWILRDRSLPAQPREHGRDQERAFYSLPELVRCLENTLQREALS